MNESTNAVSSVVLMDGGDCGFLSQAGRRVAMTKTAALIAALAASRDRDSSAFSVVAEAETVTVAVLDVEVPAAVGLVENLAGDLDTFGPELRV